jgi:hypothetical protein
MAENSQFLWVECFDHKTGNKKKVRYGLNVSTIKRNNGKSGRKQPLLWLTMFNHKSGRKRPFQVAENGHILLVHVKASNSVKRRAKR